jgi:predicted glycoside hydrolase/deacetylase ChbG (UPF0249 family)
MQRDMSAAALDQQVRTGKTIILCADDFGLSAGVSDGILELAERGHLSATSAMVTFARWPADAQRLAKVRRHLAVGLHVNLTLGAPLGPMPSVAPKGSLPTLPHLLARALSGRISTAEIAAEVSRQITRFETEVGFAPDHVDGHQHVHALPGIRRGFLLALQLRFPRGGPLVRNPAAQWRAAKTYNGALKAMVLAALAKGFKQACRAKGFATNSSFSGVSSFSRDVPFADELQLALAPGSKRHLVMCHPGHADAELSRLDPIVMRREDEFAALMSNDALPGILWRPERAADGPAIHWTTD